MKIRFEKDVLLSALTPAMSAVSDKNTISAIEGFLFTTEGDDRCTISSYDLEKGFRMTIDAQVNEGGSYIINAQKLYRIVRMMPDRYIDIEVGDKKSAKISSGKSEFSLMALMGGEFPALPELSGEKAFTLPQNVLRKMIAQVSHAISVGDQRPVLSGAYFRISSNKMTVVACDGNRLAIREREVKIRVRSEEDEGKIISFIVPGKTLGELMKMIGDTDEDVSLVFGRKHIIFTFEDKLFFSRLIDGDYINYDRVIPKNNNIKVVIGRDELIDSLERASLVTEDKSMGQVRSYVRCNFEENLLKVSSASSVSSVYDEIECEKTGDDLIIGFNCRYLLDALRAIGDDKILLSLSTPLLSMVIEKAPEEEAPEEADAEEAEKDEKEEKEDEGSYLYMVCPVKMKE